MSEFKDFFQQLLHKTGKIEIVHDFIDVIIMMMIIIIIR